jgi:hypothetical protein
VYGDEGNLCVVVGVVGAVTLGVNVSIKHHGELTLKCKFTLFICVVARARVLSILPSSFESGLQNCLSCNILQHLPKRYSPPSRLSLQACAFVRPGMAESLRVIIVCFRFIFVRLKCQICQCQSSG